MHRGRISVLALCLAVGFVITANAEVVDFSEFAPGTVIAGTLPQGGEAPGTVIPGMTISVYNDGNGPHSAIVFDSENPTGGDWDLGTPNETCDPPGPGRGVGGEVGQPGENCVPQGNILIIAEDLGDSDQDNIVDDPDDEAGGGHITFEFDESLIIEYVILLDIDNETASIDIIEGPRPGMDIVRVTIDASDLGNNSIQTLDLASFGPVGGMQINCSSSAGIPGFAYEHPPTATESLTWGEVKARFR